MSDITSNYDYVKKQIPDPQVKDVADQFYSAAQLLRSEPPGSGVLIPEVVNSVLAIELYLKSLAAYSVIRNPKDYRSGVRGGIVTAEAKQRGHKLTELFDALDPEVKQEIEKKYAESSLARGGPTFTDCLEPYDRVFERARYVYEDSSSIRGLNIQELESLTDFMNDIVNSLPTKTTIVK